MPIQNFGTNFKEAFSKGLPIGSQAYQKDQQRRIAVEEELRKQKEKVQKQNQQKQKYAELTGQKYAVDPMTGDVVIVNDPEYEFRQPSPSMMAQLFPEIGNEYQQSFTQLQKQHKEENEPDFVGTPQYVWNQGEQAYDVMQMDRKSGKPVKIGSDPNYSKRLTSNVVDGVVVIDGVKVGTHGRKSRIIIYQETDKDGKHKFDVFDLGRKAGSSGSGDEKSNELLAFDLDVADLQTKVDSVINRRDRYIRGKFSDEQARDSYRHGINSALNELSLQYAELGSQTAQKRVQEILAEGRRRIGKEKTVNRQQYYQQKKEEIEQEFVEGKWGHGEEAHQDVQAIYKFLETKYKLWVAPEDSQQADDEDMMNDIFDEINLGE